MPNIDPQLEQELRQEEITIAKIMNVIAKKEAILNSQAMRVRQNLVENTSPERLSANLKSALPGFLVPGNVGDVNRVIWPFFFSTTGIDKKPITIAPSESIKTSFTITQEASFILMNFARVVCLKTENPDAVKYIIPKEADYREAGLKFTFSDPQSGRIFFNSPTDIRQIGDPRFPTVLPSPQLMLPNSVFDINLTNENPDNTYIVSLIFGGYRLRIDGGADLLSSIYG